MSLLATGRRGGLISLLACAASSLGAAQQSVPVALPLPVPHRASGNDALRLRDVLRRAIDRHPLIEAARARVRAASGGGLTARTLANPVLSYWTENIRRPGFTPATALDLESQVYATLPLEPLFQRWPRIRRADSEVRAASADLARVRQGVLLDASRAFYRVAAAQVAVNAAAEVGTGLANLVTYNQARVQEGVAAESDLIRTQLELDRAAASVTLERVELVRARAMLAPYLGEYDRDRSLPRDSVFVLFDETERGIATTEALPSTAELIAQALDHRPDVLAARARVAAARAEGSVQRTLSVRQVGATFGAKRTLGVTSLIAGLTVPLPLFDQNRGEIQRAASELTAVELEAAWIERQAVSEVEAAVDAVRLLGERVSLMRDSYLSRAEESHRIAVAAYQEGAVTLLQVLDASRTLADARVTYYRTVFAQRQSLLELNAAIGIAVLDEPVTSSVTNSDDVQTQGPLPSRPSVPSRTSRTAGARS